MRICQMGKRLNSALIFLAFIASSFLMVAMPMSVLASEEHMSLRAMPASAEMLCTIGGCEEAHNGCEEHCLEQSEDAQSVASFPHTQTHLVSHGSVSGGRLHANHSHIYRGEDPQTFSFSHIFLRSILKRE